MAYLLDTNVVSELRKPKPLTVAARNTDDFKPFGVALINPFLTPRS